jgi:AAA+ ATPase superfamily predicted ATPase
MDSLVTWKKSQNRSFLLLRGAARVGKTWILKEFGEQEFTSSAYISFRNNRRMERLFEGDLSPQLLLQCFEMEAGVPIKADTL